LWSRTRVWRAARVCEGLRRGGRSMFGVLRCFVEQNARGSECLVMRRDMTRIGRCQLGGFLGRNACLVVANMGGGFLWFSSQDNGTTMAARPTCTISNGGTLLRESAHCLKQACHPVPEEPRAPASNDNSLQANLMA
jgi:hypothetical protein